MSLPTFPTGGTRRQMHKAVLRMRLEMHRQELRHEALQLTQPLRQVRQYGQRLRQYGQRLRQGTAPYWLGGGALALVGLLGGRRRWRRWLRLALIAVPLLRRRPAAPRRS